MSRFGADLRAAGLTVRGWATYLGHRVRRTTPGPALIRLIAGAAAMGGLAVAIPPAVLASTKVVIPVILALGVSLFPRTIWVTSVIALTVAVWLFTTVGAEMPVTVPRVGLLAAALYVTHAAAAMAAVLPFDAVTSPAMLLRWARRVLAVLVVSLTVGLAGMVLAQRLPETHSIVGPIVGSVVAAGLAGLLVWTQRRRT